MPLSQLPADPAGVAGTLSPLVRAVAATVLLPPASCPRCGAPPPPRNLDLVRADGQCRCVSVNRGSRSAPTSGCLVGGTCHLTPICCPKRKLAERGRGHARDAGCSAMDWLWVPTSGFCPVQGTACPRAHSQTSATFRRRVGLRAMRPAQRRQRRQRRERRSNTNTFLATVGAASSNGSLR